MVDRSHEPPIQRPPIWSCGALLLGLIVAVPSQAEDIIEFLSGASARGTVVEIRKPDREVVFETKLAARTVRRTYPYSKIHAIRYKGKRYLLNEKPDTASGPAKRSAGEVNALIDRVGRTPPDWFDATPLDYPETLDLDWPEPAPKPWNNRKNMGQYVWDIINPNESKWRSGIRLMHHLLDLHKDDPKLSRRVMRSLGSMYFRFFQDYPRAAFWWRQAQVAPSSIDGIGLAECYFRMGNKSMAMKALDRRRIRMETIKLLGNMEQTDQAIQLAEVMAKQVKEPQWALLAAGDACRLAGKTQQAIAYYQRVVESADMNNKDYDHRARSRAQQSIDAIRQFELLDISKIADGAYEAETLAYEGPLRVRVHVENGKIEQVEITHHTEKQYYSALRDMPRQIIAKQSVNDVDATSRATITAEAVVSATAKALAEAMGD